MKHLSLNETLSCAKKTFIISGAFKTCNIYTSGSVIMFELRDFSHAYIVPQENFKGVNKEKGPNAETNLQLIMYFLFNCSHNYHEITIH